MENFEERREKKKDSKFLIFICAVAVIGGINLAFTEGAPLLIAYILLMAVSIPFGYFHYSICKWQNKWRSRWTHRDAVDDEPSKIFLFWTKLSAWSTYGAGLLISLICTFL